MSHPSRPLALLLALATSLLLPGLLDAQAGTVRGTVTDQSGGPVSGVSIVLEGTGLGTTTLAEGAYEFRGITSGSYTLRTRRVGFKPMSARVTVTAGGVVVQDFRLTPSPIQLAPIDVTVGSRAQHTAAEELAVPVDVYTAEVIARQGTTETSQILQALAPSVNFPRQTVTDATDIVRPFTLRGLSPDHSLVLVNGWRRHQMALVNTYAYGMGAGSSGVDLNALPASATDRIEVLRDGASAQYGSDAIAGVINVVMKEGQFAPFLNADFGRYTTSDYPDDGSAVNLNGGLGFGLGRGSLGLFAEYRHRDPTDRAWADPSDQIVTGDGDLVDDEGNVIQKNNPVDQPNYHWGDGLAKDIMTFANFRMPLNDAGTFEVYSFGGYSFRQGTGNGYRRTGNDSRNWPEIYPLGFLPTFDPDVVDYSAAAGFRGLAGKWSYDFGLEFGHNDFEYNLTNTLNVSLGPCLGTPCAPGLDGILGNSDDPGIPNQTSFFAGKLGREELVTGVNVTRPLDIGLAGPLNLALGATFRRERYEITPGEPASYIQGYHLDQFGDIAPAGSQVFAGFQPAAATDDSRTNFGVYADAEANLTAKLLANVAARFETYSDFGERVTGKLALRYQLSPRFTLRGAASSGFRAPGLSQTHYTSIATNFIFDVGTGQPEPVDFGIFPADHPAAIALGAQPLEEETSLNFSAGFAVSPANNVTLTADYFHIDIDNRIILSGFLGTDSVIAILDNAGLNIDGAQYFTNAIDSRTQGVDVTGNFQWPAGGSGIFGLTLGINYTENKILEEAPLPAELDGTGVETLLDVVTRVAIEKERPEWRGTLAGNYTNGRLHSLARISYFGGFSSAQPGYCDECEESYGGKTLVDAEVGYQFNQVNLSFGVRNLFDVYPDQAGVNNNNGGTFPWAAASPFGYNGRYLYTRAEMVLGL
jgi:iron complex outermembrane receptor protein